MREKFEFVFHILGRKHRAVIRSALDTAHILDPVNDFQMPLRVDKTGIAGVVPAVSGQHFGCGLRVFVVTLEQTGRFDQNLAIAGNFDFNPFNRHAHGVSPRLVVGLQANEHSSFSAAIELLQINANGAVESKQIRPNRLACGVSNPHPAKTQGVAQRAIHQHIADAIEQLITQPQRCTVHFCRAYPLGHIHEKVKHPPLDCARILHANHHAGQQAFKHPGRRKVVRRADFFQVDGDGAGVFRAAHYIAASQPLRIAENILANPGRWQISQHFFPRC